MLQTLERRSLFIFMAVAALAPLALHDRYLLHVGVMMLIFACLASSLNLIVGYIGEFSLGHTAFFGMGAYVAALLSTKLGLPLWVLVPLAGVVAAFLGLIIGGITLQLRGPFFVIVTLCFAEILRLAAINWVDLTNGPMGLAGIPEPFHQDKLIYYYVSWLALALCAYLSYRFVYSSMGRAAVTIRENRYIAQSVGIHPFRYAMCAFVLGAFMAGVAGSLYAYYISFVGPEVFNFSFMVSMILMVLIGGKGTLLGPLIGSVIVISLEESLRGVQEFRLSLFGIIVILIVLFMPRGIVGYVYGRLRERSGKPNPSVALKGGNLHAGT
ncbi:Branched-chain amino acid transport system permease protein OS=Castellaniella defragrans OX=75697 GN=HNR28_003411 PE=4 SV=1 [Castellaniella defragrans]